MALEIMGLQSVEEGRLLADFNKRFEQAQRAIARYVETYGGESKGAKVQISLKVSITVGDPNERLFTVVSAIDVKQPGRPKRKTIALGDKDSDGFPALFARSSGTDAHHPDQQKLCTEDGRGIDPENGRPEGAPTPEPV